MPAKVTAKTQRNFAPGAFKAIHASATALAQVGALDRATLRQFDGLCCVEMAQLEAKRITSGAGESSGRFVKSRRTIETKE